MARAGDWENGWKRLFGFSRVLLSGEGPEAVDAAAFCTRDWLGGAIDWDCGCDCVRLVCSWGGKRSLLLRERELKLRTNEAEVLLHPRLELTQLCGLIADPWGLTPRRSTWRHRPQVYSPGIVGLW